MVIPLEVVHLVENLEDVVDVEEDKHRTVGVNTRIIGLGFWSYLSN